MFPFDFFGPPQINQDNIPISKSFITFAKLLFPCEITYSQVLGIRMWTPLESHCSVYQNGGALYS